MGTFKRTLFAIVSVLTLLQGSVLVEAADCEVLDAIDDINMFVLGTSLVVVWQEPSNMIECGFTNIQHTVTYSGYQSEQQVTTSEYYVYFDYYPYQCVPSVVNITASTDSLTTVQTTVEYYTETASVENLKIEEENGVLVANWNNPENSEECSFVYEVSYADDLQEFTMETNDLEADLNVSVISCVQSKLTVTPVNGKYVGVSATAEYEGDISAVRNYQLSSTDGEVVAVFDPPADVEYCELTYEVKEVEASCYTKTVDVAAFNGRIYSQWVSAEIEVEMSAVQNLAVSVNGDNIDLTWSAPERAADCAVSYVVNYNGVQSTAADTSISLESGLAACVESTATVTAVSATGKLGVASDVQLKGELASVQSLALSSGDEVISALWAAPENSSSCALSYLLEYKNELGSHWYVTDDTSYNFAYTSCATAVTLNVEPHSEDGSVGPVSTATFAASC